MDVPLYDVYLTGKLAETVSREQAGARLAQIFKANPETMLGLLTGKTQILKRGVDKNTALKYRDALQQAGVEVAFKAQTIAPVETVASPAATPAPTAAATNTTTNTRANAVNTTTAATTAATAVSPAANNPSTNTALTLAPAGADVLSAAERSHIETVVIDVSQYSVAPPGPLTDVLPHSPAQAAPSTDHLSLAASGSDLLSAAERAKIPAAVPDTSEFSLAPAGAPLETLSDERQPVQVDISQLSVAPSGTDLLTPEQRGKPAVAAPNTDHIKLV